MVDQGGTLSDFLLADERVRTLEATRSDHADPHGAS